MPKVHRFHRLTRWPSDPTRRRELAATDLEFCLAMGSILFPGLSGLIPAELSAVWSAAQRALANAANN